MAPSFAGLRERYAGWWASMKIRTDKLTQIKLVASRIVENKQRYIAVARNLGLPWFFVACLHYRESSLNFHCHLHNGDPLNARTVRVPAGRPAPPACPPFTWEESALDALRHRSFPKITSPETFAYAAEDYNGWGYYERGQSSDYLWGDTSIHPSGEFVADHEYEARAVGKQSGVMPVLSVLMSMDASVSFAPVAIASNPSWWRRVLGAVVVFLFSLITKVHT